VIVLFALAAGCVSPAERDFTVADVKVIGDYIAAAQPAAEAYADALAASGHAEQAEQLRADCRALARQIQADAATRLGKLMASGELIDEARMALSIASAILEALPRTSASTTATRPAGGGQ